MTDSRFLAAILIGASLAAPAAAQSVDARKIVDDIATQYVTAYNKNDATAIANMYTQDGMFMPPNGAPPLNDRQAIERVLSERFKEEGGQLKSSPTGAKVVDSHTILGNGDYVIAPSRGPNLGKERNGRWGEVLVEDSGAWHIKALITNLTLPPQPAVSGSTTK